MSGSGPTVTPTPRGILRHYWRVAGVRWWHLAVPVSLILISTALDGAALSLLIPLTDAISENSFGFLEESRWFGWLPGLVPNSVTEPAARDTYLVFITIGLIILGRVGKLGFQYLARLFTTARNERYRVLVAGETFGRALTFGRKYFDDNAIGRIDTEIGWSGSVLALLIAVQEIFRYVISLVAKAVVMIAISIPLALAFLVTLPLMQWLVAAVNRAVRRISEEALEVDRTLRSRMLDLLGSIPLVKAYSQEGVAKESYSEVLREAERVAIRRDRFIGIRYPVEETTILLAMLLVQGAFTFFAGDFRPADLAVFGAFLIVLQQALKDYKSISRFALRLFEELPRLEAVARLFSDEGKSIVPSGPQSFQGLQTGIEIRELDFRYTEDVKGLQQVTATIAAQKMTAVVGPSGAGKTTLIDLVARLYDCPTGTIFLDGVDIREFSLASLHSKMAIVSQEVWLLNRSLRENLTFGLHSPVADAELVGALEDLLLGDFLASLPNGLDTEVGDRGVRLSGGQRQRISLARALLRNPEILILDEATSAVDSVIELHVAEAIKRRLAGHTLIVIAHRLSTIRDANLILVMEEGRIVERGTWEELLSHRGAFYSLHQAQSE